MSKWLDQYLQEFHTDSTDINEKVQKLSVLSVPTLLINEKIEEDKLYIAGDDLITTTTISNFPNTKKVSTDNTDKNWDELVKKTIAEQKITINVLACFLVEFEKSGFDLLPDDKKWLRKICADVSGSRLKGLLDQYAYHWRTSMTKEVLPHKQQNIGRFTANTFLLESVTSHVGRN